MYQILLTIFLETINGILFSEFKHNQLYCIETKKKSGDVVMSFNANDFKKFLGEKLKESKISLSIATAIKCYRDFGFLVSENNRLTFVKKYKGKSIRTISVRKSAYDRLKELKFYESKYIEKKGLQNIK